MSGAASAAGSRALALVNLAAVERNASLLAAATPRLCAVVKADAYGHGARACALAALAGGAAQLAVATAQEASELREVGIDAPILVLGPLEGPELDVALAARAELVAWSEEFLDMVCARGGGAIHVKLDSGMGRLGTSDTTLATLLAERAASSPQLELVGAMTHLASADEPDGGFVDAQLARFEAWVAPLRERHPGILLHAENSAALLAAGRGRYGMARCGVALYGLDPFGVDAARRGLEPALELRTRVALLKHLRAGDSAGYGRRFVATEPTVLALLPLGYADGVRRAISGGGVVLIGGRRRPVAGAVSMDSLTVDLGAAGDVALGDPAVLIGRLGAEQISAEELAALLGTINYEITCAISARVPRAYHHDGIPWR